MSEKKRSNMTKTSSQHVKINDPGNSLEVMRIIRNFNSTAVRQPTRDKVPAPKSPPKK